MLTNLRNIDFMGIIRNYWVILVSAMVVGNAVGADRYISRFLEKVSGGKVR